MRNDGQVLRVGLKRLSIESRRNLIEKRHRKSVSNRILLIIMTHIGEKLSAKEFNIREKYDTLNFSIHILLFLKKNV